MNDCINCEYCINIDKDKHQGYCNKLDKIVFVQIDGCEKFLWKIKKTTTK